MDIDLARSAQLIKGSLLEEKQTWPEYAAQRVPFMNTLLWVTLPAVLASAFLAYLLNLIFADVSLFGRDGIGSLFASIVGGLLGVAIWAAAAYFFAGLFDGAKPDAGIEAPTAVDTDTDASAETATQPPAPESHGKASFDQAFAAVSFGFLPGFVGMVLGSLPWIGFLLMLIALVYGLMTLYRAIPVFLGVAEDNRIKHFIATFLTALIASMVLSTVFGGIFIGSQAQQARYETERNLDALEASLGGDDEQNVPDLLGVGNQVDYFEAAAADTYTPPKNGRLRRDQVERTVLFLQRTETIRERAGDKLKRMAEDADGGDATPSLGDLFKGIRGAVTVGTAEMQVVKAGGGNWAEHEWVKQALYQAQLMQDQNPTSEANYKLYLEHEESLNELL